MRRQNATDLVTRLAIIIIGLALWAVGTNLHDFHFWGLRVGELLSHLGVLIAVVVLFHWIYESRVRNELVKDILSIGTGSLRIAESGISDFVINSRDIDYGEELATASEIKICVHYNPTFLENHYKDLEALKDKRCRVTVYALQENCVSLDYLITTRGENSAHIKPNMAKIRAMIGDLRNLGIDIGLVEHDSILRYSFVSTERLVWVKFYKNALGRSPIPAICVRRPSLLFDFFKKDIDDLVPKQVVT